jgi:hypothetical protein
LTNAAVPCVKLAVIVFHENGITTLRNRLIVYFF